MSVKRKHFAGWLDFKKIDLQWFYHWIEKANKCDESQTVLVVFEIPVNNVGNIETDILEEIELLIQNKYSKEDYIMSEMTRWDLGPEVPGIVCSLCEQKLFRRIWYKTPAGNWVCNDCTLSKVPLKR